MAYNEQENMDDASAAVAQGISIFNNKAVLGDEAAGNAQSGAFLSDRFLNLNGKSLGVVGEDGTGVVISKFNDDGSFQISSEAPVTNEQALLILNGEHNITGDGIFLKRYPGNYEDAANSTVVPWVIHALKGENPTGFNEAPQADYVYAYGINMRRFVGDPYHNPLRGGLAQSMELYYDALDDTQGKQEYHLVHSRPSGIGEVRFLTFQGFEDPLLGSTVALQTGRDDLSQDAISFRTEAGVDRVVFDWGAKAIRIKNQIAIGFEVNNVAAITQSNAANDNVIEIARVNANDEVVLASGVYRFESSTTNIYTTDGHLSIGTDTHPISEGLLTTSTDNNLLRLKSDGTSNIWMASQDANTFYLGRNGAQTTIFGFNKDATANAFYIADDGGLYSPGQASGLGRINALGMIGGKAFTTYNANTADGVNYYASGTVTGNSYLFLTDLTASGKAIGMLRNYTGHAQMILWSQGATKTSSIQYIGNGVNYNTGIDNNTNSFHIYLGGDVLAGGTSVLEFTSAGRLKRVLDIFADDAAAGVGGLATGEWYQETTTGYVRVKQ